MSVNSIRAVRFLGSISLIIITGLWLTSCSDSKDKTESEQTSTAIIQATNQDKPKESASTHNDSQVSDSTAWGKALDRAQKEARKSKDEMLDFEVAVLQGDAQKARFIWQHLEDATSKSAALGLLLMSFSDPELTQSMFAKLGPGRFEQSALLLSAINQSTMTLSDTKSANPGSGNAGSAHIKGFVKDSNSRKGLADTTVIVAGQKMQTDEKGHFEFFGLPTGTFAEFVFKPGLARPAVSIMSKIYDGRSEQIALDTTPVYEQTTEVTPIPGLGNLSNDDARARFDLAIKNGDTVKLNQLWTHMDRGSKFYTIGNPALPFRDSLKVLYLKHNADKFATTASYLSRIELSHIQFLPEVLSSDQTHRMKGVAEDFSTHQPLAAYTIIWAGQTATTDEKGTFTFTNAPYGRFLIIMFKPGAEELSYFALDYSVATEAQLQVTNFIAQLHQKQKQADYTGQASLDAQIIDADTAAPISDIPVTILFSEEILFNPKAAQKQISDANGKIHFSNLPTGTYNILLNPSLEEMHGAIDGKITIKPQNEPRVWKLKKLQGSLDIPSGSLSGTVVRADKETPIKGVLVAISDADHIMTNKQGQFMLTLPSTGAKISLDEIQDLRNLEDLAKKAEEKSSQAGQSLILTASHEDYEPYSETIVNNAMEGQTKTVYIRLSPLPYADISGQVLDGQTQQPVAGAQVLSTDNIAVNSAEDGSFYLKKVHSGHVNISAEAQHYHPGQTELDLLPLTEQTTTILLQPITTGTLSGLALDGTTEKPLADVKITIGDKSSRTDAGGRFDINDIEAGKLYVTGEKPVFKSIRMDLEIKADEKQDITLRLQPVTTGTLTGLVLNAASGEALADARVRLGDIQKKTDSQGRFNLTEIPTGQASAEASLAVFTSQNQAVNIEAAKITKITFKLAPITNGAVAGTVRDKETQVPLAMVQVQIGEQQTQTDNNGHFVLEKISLGKAQISTSKTLYKTSLKDLEIKAAETTELSLELEAITTGSIYGKAIDSNTGQALSAATVTAGGRGVQTDATGQYRLNDIDVGELVIEASKPVYEAAAIKQILKAGVEQEVNFKLIAITYAGFKGDVLNAKSGEPIAAANIQLGSQSTLTDKTGHFSLDHTATGQLQALATKQGFVSAEFSLTLIPAETVTHTFKLTPITTVDVSGQAIDKITGKAVKNVRISAGTKATETDTDGTFILQDVALGDTSLYAQHPDYKDYSLALTLEAGQTYTKTLKLQRRREDVAELEKALDEKGVVDLYGIHFDSGKDQFLPSSLATLNAVLEVIKSTGGQTFEIAGHTDSDGEIAYNQDLSRRRAKTVIDWLLVHGVKSEQLKAHGYGESQPVAPNTTSTGRALNRRVQLKVVK